MSDWHRKADLADALKRDCERRQYYRFPLVDPSPTERQSRRETVFSIVMILSIAFGMGFLAVVGYLIGR